MCVRYFEIFCILVIYVYNDVFLFIRLFILLEVILFIYVCGWFFDMLVKIIRVKNVIVVFWSLLKE